MSEAAIVLGTVGAALVLFVTGWVGFDVTAVGVLLVLAGTGIVDLPTALSGLSSPATVTIACMLVLSRALERNGALNHVVEAIERVSRTSRSGAYWALLSVIGVMSGFVNNTAVTAVFIPLSFRLSKALDTGPSRLLVSVSFVSIMGGVCTVVGTSTNLIVSGIATDNGHPPLGMFELLPVGAVILVAGMVYLATIGEGLVPDRRTEGDLVEAFAMRSYLTDVVLKAESRTNGKRLLGSPLLSDLDLDVLEVRQRENPRPIQELEELVVHEGDTLRVRGKASEIRRLLDRDAIELHAASDVGDVDLEAGAGVLVEAVVAPDSDLAGQRVADVDFPRRFKALLLAVRSRGDVTRSELPSIQLEGGDSLLLVLPRDRVDQLRRSPAFYVLSTVDPPPHRPFRALIAALTLLAVVTAGALGAVPVVMAALTGCLVVIASGCLTSEEAYEAINWKVIVLLAGIIPLGAAMKSSGAADMIGGGVVAGLGPFGPHALLAGIFLITVLMTNAISNVAAAALMAPVALQASGALDIAPRPLLIAVTLGASLSFLTPIGYQTNTLIYGPGQFKFTDFLRVGTPLTLLCLLLTTLLVPVVWPF